MNEALTTQACAKSIWWAPQAWINDQWHFGVCLEADAQGRWSRIQSGCSVAPEHATVLPGAVLPGMVNAHSHAFQRAFAGLAERKLKALDDFWSWRDRMYGVALRMTPAQMRAIAAQLYVELLKGGYTQVCEFHYLHHQENGQAYADPATMSWSLADAANDARIGLTLLPVLYERAGFKERNLRNDQQRFASTAELVRHLHQSINAARRTLVNSGVAIHSLRAVSPDAITALLSMVGDQDIPIHIHIAEQMQEVHDCLAHSGHRPVDWLLRSLPVDSRWQLIHATHCEEAEIAAIARSSAGIVVCPTTEANLGDGLTNVPAWLNARIPIALGSDSHVCRQWGEELRWLEYGQRLQLQKRNVCADHQVDQGSTASRLFNLTLDAGGRAAGLGKWGLCEGARADMLVLNPHNSALLGIAPTHLLDALVFASDSTAIADVYVAGQRVVSQGEHVNETRIAQSFTEAMHALWVP